MAYIGQSPAPQALVASDISDGIISTAKLADTSVTNAKLNADLISAEAELATSPADTDEFLVSDSGVLKRLDASLVGGGKVLQVLYDVQTTQQSTTSNTYADTALSIDITPSATSSKILVICNIQMIVKSGGDTSCGLKIFRASTNIGRTSNCNSGSSADRRVGSASWCILDEPSTTSATTYKVQIANENNGVGTSYMNYSAGNAGASQLTLLEIGA